jgi:FKBP-type peptidyl-prolyl cis-trans isomerase (trigger factor)
MAPADRPEMSDSKMKKMLEFMAEMMPKDTKITRGYVKGDRAVLYLEGTTDGEKQFGTVELGKKGKVWKVVKEKWSDKPPQ